SSVAFVAQFTKPVSGLNGSGIVVPSGVSLVVTPVNAQNGFAATYNIYATGITSGAAVNLGFLDGAASDANGDLSVGLTPGLPLVTVDKTAPTALIALANGQAGNSTTTIKFAVQFSESVLNFGSGNLVLSGSAIGGATAAITAGTGNLYTVTVAGIHTPGTV